MATNTRKRGRRSGKTAEQRQAEAQALHDTLTEQVQALVDSGAWRTYLDFMAGFRCRTYSLNNLLLVLAQRPDASLVAGFRQWQEKGRQVRAGERSIKIRGFSTKKITETDETTGDEVEKRLQRFPILSVFDISQTDPIEGAPQPEEPSRRLTGEDPAGIYEAMAAHMIARGWSVTREEIVGETNGYTTTDGSRRIVVETTLSPAMAAKTMLHEAAHAFLHVDEDGKRPEDPERVAHRGVREAEAEATAYVLAAMAGLDTTDYSVGYIAGWTSGDVDQVRGTAANVLGAVQSLTPAILPEDDVDQVERDAQPAA